MSDDLNPLRVKRIFEKIIAEDCELLAMDPRLARPEWMLLENLPVPPACIRPSVAMDQQGGSNEDDLTMRLQEILLLNQVVAGDIAKGPIAPTLLEKWESLQFSIAHYINSDTPGAPSAFQNKSGRGLCQRLKGKQGRFRGNLSGKRVDFSGRTVISPDPNLRIDEVGVPRDVALIMTYPERVTKHNKERMKKLVRNGPTIHPGARFIEKKNGTRFMLGYGSVDQQIAGLQEGDIVERHLQDGDVVLFNRQPSLHRVSIMAHKARVMPWKTFRFNECCCTPYNADFDGDEMNLHLPQTEEARAEALMLMSVPQNLAVPKSGELLIGATQDFLTSAWIITSRDAFYTRSEFCQIVNGFLGTGERIKLPMPTIIKPVELWTGKQIFSVLISPNTENHLEINMEMKLKNWKKKDDEKPYLTEQDTFLVVYRGELLCGQVDKSAIGGGKTTLFAHMLKQFSPEVAVDRMSKLARMCARYLGNRGFSIGIGDVTPSRRLIVEKAKLVEGGYAECEKVITLAKSGKLEVQPGTSVDSTLESKLNGVLSELRDTAGGKTMEDLILHDYANSPLIMSLCGSKGSKINIAQMIVCVGQQTLNGQRIPDGFVQRTLPHFDVNAREPAAKGFVKHSFFDGLTGTEFFFHTMGGREGLVDTAVKTAETGYMQRRLMKALEDLSVQYDNTVRSSNGSVVQFTYGDDGIEPTFTEDDDNPVNYSLLWNTVQTTTSEIDYSNPSLRPLLPAQIKTSVQKHLRSPTMQKYVALIRERIMTHFQEDVIDRLSQLRERIGLGSRKVDFPKLSDQAHARFGGHLDDQKLQSYVDQLLAVTETQIVKFFERVALKLHAVIAEPGTAVGGLCAQSIGEPCTQMTLKTFHFAGVASMNITMGVPRIREIINATKKINTPVMSIKLKNPINEEQAKFIRGYTERTTLGDIASYIKERYRPKAPSCSIIIKLDQDRMRALRVFVSAEKIAHAITEHKKLKLKPHFVKAFGRDKIEILPPPPESFLKAAGRRYSVKNVYFVLQALKALLPDVVVAGIDACSRCVIRQTKKDSKEHDGKVNEYDVLTGGNDLLGVMAAPGVDPAQTSSNHILEVNRCLGIEAARTAIVHQINETMKSHSVKVDPRHLGLLADCMTYKGEVLGITRFGVSKMKDSVLMLASFEKTTDYLFDAGQRALKEPVEGVSECIIMGRPIPLGTGLFKVLHQPPESVFPRSKNVIEFEPKPLLFNKIESYIPTQKYSDV
jgi:DNA-directed RNA polymerase III subunit RPC1